MAFKRLLLIIALVVSIMFINIAPVYANVNSPFVPPLDNQHSQSDPGTDALAGQTNTPTPTSIPTPLPLDTTEEDPTQSLQPTPNPTPLPTPTPIPFTMAMIYENTYELREEGLEIRGVIPYINHLFHGGHEQINQRISLAADMKINAAKDIRARSIIFSYEIYISNKAVSLVLFSTVTAATTSTNVVSINFEPTSGFHITPYDAVGYDIIPLAQKILNEKIRLDPGTYNAAFDAIPINQAYYLTEGKLVLVFNQFQFVKNSEGAARVEIDLAHVHQNEITRAGYHQDVSEYMVRMIPLRQVMGALGYTVNWLPGSNNIDIFIDNVFFMRLTIGINSYVIPERKPQSLESAPIVIRNNIFVPISFFDQVLSLVTYSVDDRANIMFFSYSE